MKNKKMCAILFIVVGIICMSVGLLASVHYLKSYAIDNSGVLDDLQSGIVTCFFILPLGIYIFYLGLKLINDKEFNPTVYGSKAICLPLIIINFIGVILGVYIAIKYDMAFICLSIVLLLMICLLVFIMAQSLSHPGSILSSKSRKFVALALNHSFYIDGVDVFDKKNQIGIKNKQMMLYLNKYYLGQVDQVYIIQGQTTKFYVALLELNDNVDAVYYVNLKPHMYLSFNSQENLMKNVEGNKTYIKKMLINEGYTFESEVAYKITKINEEEYHLEVIEILPIPCFKFDIAPTVMTHFPICDENFSSLEEAKQELQDVISAFTDIE